LGALVLEDIVVLLEESGGPLRDAVGFVDEDVDVFPLVQVRRDVAEFVDLGDDDAAVVVAQELVEPGDAGGVFEVAEVEGGEDDWDGGGIGEQECPPSCFRGKLGTGKGKEVLVGRRGTGMSPLLCGQGREKTVRKKAGVGEFGRR